MGDSYRERFEKSPNLNAISNSNSLQMQTAVTVTVSVATTTIKGEEPQASRLEHQIMKSRHQERISFDTICVKPSKSRDHNLTSPFNLSPDYPVVANLSQAVLTNAHTDTDTDTNASTSALTSTPALTAVASKLQSDS